MSDKTACLKPTVPLLVKLGSIAVHVEEMLSPRGHGFDKIALEQLLVDPEYIAWREQMTAMAMLPVMRNKPATKKAKRRTGA